nr:uncharacterized protein Flg2 [Rattus norvegicus]
MTYLLRSVVTIIDIFYKYTKQDEECGTLSKNELKELLEKEFRPILKNPDDPDTVDVIMHMLDRDHDRRLDFTEFILMVFKLALACNKVLGKEYCKASGSKKHRRGHQQQEEESETGEEEETPRQKSGFKYSRWNEGEEHGHSSGGSWGRAKYRRGSNSRKVERQDELSSLEQSRNHGFISGHSWSSNKENHGSKSEERGEKRDKSHGSPSRESGEDYESGSRLNHQGRKDHSELLHGLEKNKHESNYTQSREGVEQKLGYNSASSGNSKIQSHICGFSSSSGCCRPQNASSSCQTSRSGWQGNQSCCTQSNCQSGTSGGQGYGCVSEGQSSRCCQPKPRSCSQSSSQRGYGSKQCGQPQNCGRQQRTGSSHSSCCGRYGSGTTQSSGYGQQGTRSCGQSSSSHQKGCRSNEFSKGGQHGSGSGHSPCCEQHGTNSSQSSGFKQHGHESGQSCCGQHSTASGHSSGYGQHGVGSGQSCHFGQHGSSSGQSSISGHHGSGSHQSSSSGHHGSGSGQPSGFGEHGSGSHQSSSSGHYGSGSSQSSGFGKHGSGSHQPSSSGHHGSSSSQSSGFGKHGSGSHQSSSSEHHGSGSSQPSGFGEHGSGSHQSSSSEHHGSGSSQPSGFGEHGSGSHQSSSSEHHGSGSGQPSGFGKHGSGSHQPSSSGHHGSSSSQSSGFGKHGSGSHQSSSSEHHGSGSSQPSGFGEHGSGSHQSSSSEHHGSGSSQPSGFGEHGSGSHQSSSSEHHGSGSGQPSGFGKHGSGSHQPSSSGHHGSSSSQSSGFGKHGSGSHQSSSSEHHGSGSGQPSGSEQRGAGSSHSSGFGEHGSGSHQSSSSEHHGSGSGQPSGFGEHGSGSHHWSSSGHYGSGSGQPSGFGKHGSGSHQSSSSEHHGSGSSQPSGFGEHGSGSHHWSSSGHYGSGSGQPSGFGKHEYSTHQPTSSGYHESGSGPSSRSWQHRTGSGQSFGFGEHESGPDQSSSSWRHWTSSGQSQYDNPRHTYTRRTKRREQAQPESNNSEDHSVVAQRQSGYTYGHKEFQHGESLQREDETSQRQSQESSRKPQSGKKEPLHSDTSKEAKRPQFNTETSEEHQGGHQSTLSPVKVRNTPKPHRGTLDPHSDNLDFNMESQFMDNMGVLKGRVRTVVDSLSTVMKDPHIQALVEAPEGHQSTQSPVKVRNTQKPHRDIVDPLTAMLHINIESQLVDNMGVLKVSFRTALDILNQGMNNPHMLVVVELPRGHLSTLSQVKVLVELPEDHQSTLSPVTVRSTQDSHRDILSPLTGKLDINIESQVMGNMGNLKASFRTAVDILSTGLNSTHLLILIEHQGGHQSILSPVKVRNTQDSHRDILNLLTAMLDMSIESQFKGNMEVLKASARMPLDILSTGMSSPHLLMLEGHQGDHQFTLSPVKVRNTQDSHRDILNLLTDMLDISIESQFQGNMGVLKASFRTAVDILSTGLNSPQLLILIEHQGGHQSTLSPVKVRNTPKPHRGTLDPHRDILDFNMESQFLHNMGVLKGRVRTVVDSLSTVMKDPHIHALVEAPEGHQSTQSPVRVRNTQKPHRDTVDPLTAMLHINIESQFVDNMGVLKVSFRTALDILNQGMNNPHMLVVVELPRGHLSTLSQVKVLVELPEDHQSTLSPVRVWSTQDSHRDILSPLTGKRDINIESQVMGNMGVLKASARTPLDILSKGMNSPHLLMLEEHQGDTQFTLSPVKVRNTQDSHRDILNLLTDMLDISIESQFQGNMGVLKASFRTAVDILSTGLNSPHLLILIGHQGGHQSTLSPVKVRNTQDSHRDILNLLTAMLVISIESQFKGNMGVLKASFRTAVDILSTGLNSPHLLILIGHQGGHQSTLSPVKVRNTPKPHRGTLDPQSDNLDFNMKSQFMDNMGVLKGRVRTVVDSLSTVMKDPHIQALVEPPEGHQSTQSPVRVRNTQKPHRDTVDPLTAMLHINIESQFVDNMGVLKVIFRTALDILNQGMNNPHMLVVVELPRGHRSTLSQVKVLVELPEDHQSTLSPVRVRNTQDSHRDMLSPLTGKRDINIESQVMGNMGVLKASARTPLDILSKGMNSPHLLMLEGHQGDHQFTLSPVKVRNTQDSHRDILNLLTAMLVISIESQFKGNMGVLKASFRTAVDILSTGLHSPHLLILIGHKGGHQSTLSPVKVRNTRKPHRGTLNPHSDNLDFNMESQFMDNMGVLKGRVRTVVDSLTTVMKDPHIQALVEAPEGHQSTQSPVRVRNTQKPHRDIVDPLTAMLDINIESQLVDNMGVLKVSFRTALDILNQGMNNPHMLVVVELPRGHRSTLSQVKVLVELPEDHQSTLSPVRVRNTQDSHRDILSPLTGKRDINIESQVMGNMGVLKASARTPLDILSKGMNSPHLLMLEEHQGDHQFTLSPVKQRHEQPSPSNAGGTPGRSPVHPESSEGEEHSGFSQRHSESAHSHAGHQHRESVQGQHGSPQSQFQDSRHKGGHQSTLSPVKVRNTPKPHRGTLDPHSDNLDFNMESQFMDNMGVLKGRVRTVVDSLSTVMKDPHIQALVEAPEGHQSTQSPVRVRNTQKPHRDIVDPLTAMLDINIESQFVDNMGVLKVSFRTAVDILNQGMNNPHMMVVVELPRGHRSTLSQMKVLVELPEDHQSTLSPMRVRNTQDSHRDILSPLTGKRDINIGSQVMGNMGVLKASARTPLDILSKGMNSPHLLMLEEHQGDHQFTLSPVKVRNTQDSHRDILNLLTAMLDMSIESQFKGNMGVLKASARTPLDILSKAMLVISIESQFKGNMGVLKASFRTAVDILSTGLNSPHLLILIGHKGGHQSTLSPVKVRNTPKPHRGTLDPHSDNLDFNMESQFMDNMGVLKGRVRTVVDSLSTVMKDPHIQALVEPPEGHQSTQSPVRVRNTQKPHRDIVDPLTAMLDINIESQLVDNMGVLKVSFRTALDILNQGMNNPHMPVVVELPRGHRSTLSQVKVLVELPEDHQSILSPVRVRNTQDSHRDILSPLTGKRDINIESQVMGNMGVLEASFRTAVDILSTGLNSPHLLILIEHQGGHQSTLSPVKVRNTPKPHRGTLDPHSDNLDFNMESQFMDNMGVLKGRVRTVVDSLGMVMKDPHIQALVEAPEGHQSTQSPVRVRNTQDSHRDILNLLTAMLHINIESQFMGNMGVLKASFRTHFQSPISGNQYDSSQHWRHGSYGREDYDYGQTGYGPSGGSGTSNHNSSPMRSTHSATNMQASQRGQSFYFSDHVRSRANEGI